MTARCITDEDRQDTATGYSDFRTRRMGLSVILHGIDSLGRPAELLNFNDHDNLFVFAQDSKQCPLNSFHGGGLSARCCLPGPCRWHGDTYAGQTGVGQNDEDEPINTKTRVTIDDD